MKYDRPVWQLMHACADALTEAFRYEDVRTWFAENYPEIGEATIRAHVVGLTEGGAKHAQFERRSPIFRRVERGVYAPIPFEERGELPEDGPADESLAPVRFTVGVQPHDEVDDIIEVDDASEARAGEFWQYTPQQARDDAMAQAELDVQGARNDLVAGQDPETAESEGAERIDQQEDKRGRTPHPLARKEREIAEMMGRAMRARSEVERSEGGQAEFERAERDRLDLEQIDREQQERDLLDREERDLQMTLRPMLGDESTRPSVGDDRVFIRPGADAPDGPGASFGGIVIIRAPRSAPQADVDPVVGVTADEVVARPEGGDAFRDLDDDGSARAASDAILLGSIGERLRVPAPARDAFRDLAFQRARLDAELSGARWFVLSVEHGLLEPEEWMSPDERAMTDIEPSQRAAWASWVVARLESLVGNLPGQLVQVEAPGAIAEPVLAALRQAGASVVTGPIDHAESVPRIDNDDFGPADLDDEPDDVVGADHRLGLRPNAQVIPFARGGSIPEHLSDPRHAVPATAAGSLPHHTGLYAWTVDHTGSRDLNRALRLPVRAGVIFVGQVGGSAGPSGSGFSLHDHITRVQLHGRARSSTFRMTLATALSGLLRLRTIEDPRLSQWMLDHLSITVWPTGDVASLHDLKEAVVDDLRPVLNVNVGHDTEYRDRIAELSDRLA